MPEDAIPALGTTVFQASRASEHTSRIMDRIRDEGAFTSKLAKIQSAKLSALDLKEVCIPNREYSSQCFKMAERHLRAHADAFVEYARVKQRAQEMDPEGALTPLLAPLETAVAEMVSGYIWLYRAGFLDWELNNKLYATVEDGFRKGWEKAGREDLAEELQSLTQRFISVQQIAKAVSPESLKKAEEELTRISEKESLMRVSAEERILLVDEEELYGKIELRQKEKQRWLPISHVDLVGGNKNKIRKVLKRLLAKGRAIMREEGLGKYITVEKLADQLPLYPPSSPQSQRLIKSEASKPSIDTEHGSTDEEPTPTDEDTKPVERKKMTDLEKKIYGISDDDEPEETETDLTGGGDDEGGD